MKCCECGKNYKVKDMYKRNKKEYICKWCEEETEPFYGEVGS